MSRLGSSVLALALLAGMLWAGSRTAPEAVNAVWAQNYDRQLRRVLNLPPGVRLEFKRAQANHDGQVVAVFDALAEDVRASLELAVSPDGTQLFYEGRTYELADPFAALRAGLQVENAPSRGPASAPVTIVEFSDYTCTFCRKFALTREQALLDRYAGRVRLVYKQFPLAQERLGAEESAVAAACAFRQGNGQFWSYHEGLFREADNVGQGRPLFLRLARDASLDLPVFTRCLDEGEGLVDVARDVEEGEALGVEITPTFFFNGRPVYGLVREEYFSHIIEQELAAVRAR